MSLTTRDELLEVSIGDRMVQFTGRVIRMNKSKDGKHLFVTFASSDSTEVSLKAFENEAKRLQPYVKAGSILCFEGLKADNIYKDRSDYCYDFELKFERYSTVTELADEPIGKEVITSFEELESGRKYIVECYLKGNMLEIGNSYLGGCIVDEKGQRGELYIRSSMKDYNAKYGLITGNKKIKFVCYAETLRGIHLTVDDLKSLEHVEALYIELPKKALKRSASPPTASPESKKQFNE